MRLVGLDFETANYKSGSICAAGCALVEDGQLRYQEEWRICPPKECRWMHPRFTQIHGITWDDVKYSPEFPQVWPQIQRYLNAADCVIIHNAPFDLGQLRRILQIYSLPKVEFYYADSVVITRRKLPQLRSHSLNSVAQYYGISFHHHNAMEDAAACAIITAYTGIPTDLLRHFSFEPT